MNWVYVCSEPGLYTVGFYSPDGKWHTDSDHKTKGLAAERCAYLNGTCGKDVMEAAKELLSWRFNSGRRKLSDVEAIIHDKLAPAVDGAEGRG